MWQAFKKNQIISSFEADSQEDLLTQIAGFYIRMEDTLTPDFASISEIDEEGNVTRELDKNALCEFNNELRETVEIAVADDDYQYQARIEHENSFRQPY